MLHESKTSEYVIERIMAKHGKLSEFDTKRHQSRHQHARHEFQARRPDARPDFLRASGARYAESRSLERNFYQAGASTHRGRVVPAVPRHDAERKVLKDWRLYA